MLTCSATKLRLALLFLESCSMRPILAPALSMNTGGTSSPLGPSCASPLSGYSFYMLAHRRVSAREWEQIDELDPMQYCQNRIKHREPELLIPRKALDGGRSHRA